MSSEENSAAAAEVEEEDSFVVIDEVTDNQTESDKGQGTELGSELLIDSVETEKEIDSFLKNESKRQHSATENKSPNTAVKHAPKEGKKLVVKAESKQESRITSRYALSVGGLRTGDKRVLTQMLLKRFGKNKYIMKPTRLGDKYTYLYFRSRECMKTAEKMLNNKMISGHRITAKVVEKRKVEKKTETKEKEEVVPKKNVPKEDGFGSEDYNEQVKYKEKFSRRQVLSLGDTLESYLPPLKALISDRKKRHNGLICKVDRLKQCAPKSGAYCKCSFLIDLDADTGKPILGRFYNDGKVRKNWNGKQFYHSSILQAAEVFEKFVISSEWEVGRSNKGFWRKIHIRCNNSGELLLWLLVQSPEEKASEELKKLKALLTQFFQKGEGRKCKISSVYTRVTFTSSSKSNPRGGSMINLTMGKEYFEDHILGFKIKINPKISTLWNMEQSSMMCDAVKDLIALDDHTSVIIIGLNDSGLLALIMANQAGEVICVDKRIPVADAKMNVNTNRLESKCKFHAGFASEELKKITPKYKKVYAVILVPTVTEIMAFKERKNLSDVKTIVTFVECSKLNSRPMKLLADPEQGAAFFPSRIIPFDTHPNEKTYMMAIRLERLHVPGVKRTIMKNLTKSSTFRSSRNLLINKYRERRSRLPQRSGVSAPEKRERNRMLPDAREVILARRYRKEKEQLKSAPRFNSYEQPNLVIEVKKPSYGSTAHGEAYAERYVKERKLEAEEYRQRSMEDRGLKSRPKPNIQDVLTDSLKQTLPSINEDTAEKLKQVIAEAITGAGFLTGSSSRERKRRTPSPRAIERRSEEYMKYNHSSMQQRYERQTPVLRHADEGRRLEEKQIEINRHSYRNSRTDKKLPEDAKYERISPTPFRMSPNYTHTRSSLEASKRYEADKYDIDRRLNEARVNEDRSYGGRRDIHRSDYTKEILPPSSRRSRDEEERLRRTVEHERNLLPTRRGEADDYKRGIRPSFDRIATRDQQNIDRRNLDILEFEKRNSSLTRRSLEEREMSLHKRGLPPNDMYNEREALLVRKRALEVESHVSDHGEKRRRSQDRDPYDHRDISSVKRRSLGDPPYRSSERAVEVPHYLVKEDVHARKMAEVDRYERFNERDRDALLRRDISSSLPQTPSRVRERDYRHPAVGMEKQSLLPQGGFGALSSGSATSLDRRPAFQNLDRRLGPESMLSSSNYPLTSLPRDMNLLQPPGVDFRRPYSSFTSPR